MKSLLLKSCMTSLSLAVWLGASGLDVEEKETIQKTFDLASAGGELRIDNIDGSIHVAGQAGSAIQFIIEKTSRAESKEKIDLARQEVKLDLSQKENVVQAYVDAPWRCRDGGINYRGRRFDGYRVRFDFEVKVPVSTRLFLRTVNHGEIRVENTAGEFDIENVNGGIEMLEIAGSGRAYALNGNVKVVFSQNPKAEAFFGSLNGKVEALFREGLSADLLFKTFNGNVYTDFPVTYLPSRPPLRGQRDGKYVYKSDGFFGVRAGSGGPELKFDAFNGNIHVLKSQK
jgi:hypothetical protein